MSTQKSLISDPKKARRRMSSVLAEAYIGNKLGWKIGALSAGYGSYTPASLLELCKFVTAITQEKVWLNVGVLSEKTLEKLKPYLEGVYGAVETTNERVHKEVAPNKPIAPIEKMFAECEKLGLRKAMTFIVGMGETIDDFNSLENFIIQNNVDKITFYALNPIKGTVFEHSKGPSIEYYLQWIEKTRKAFPNIDIVAGPWVSRVEHISKMLEAGANSLTKFPALKMFGSEFAFKIENEIAKAGYHFESTFTKMPEIDFKDIEDTDLPESLKKEIIEKIEQYLEGMRKHRMVMVEEP